MIPEKIENLVYSKHALSERCRDRHGFIEFTPRSFFKSGCKSFGSSREGCIKVVYIYNDKLDINLIINPETKIVVTNYLTISNNTGIYKGRFRVESILNKKK